MPAYNFNEAFAPRVEMLIKRQTVRRKRKRQTKIGDMLYLYTGMRTKKCRLLLSSICLLVEDIDIMVGGIDTGGHSSWIHSPKADTFSEADGFNDSGEMIAWFAALYGLPFHGEVIYW